jgi:WD40 repeat protein
MPIEESDIATHSGEKGIAGNACWVFKGVYLHNIETGKTVRIDSDLINQVPSSSFSRDGSLFITSLSFSHDGKFLFITSPPDYLLIFSVEQMKFIKVFNTNDIFAFSIHNVDKALDNLYILAGTDSSNVFQFDMDKKELKSITNCQECQELSYAISPDNKSLVFIETNFDGKTDLGIVNLANGTIKMIDYPRESEIAGFVSDSKHLIITHHYKLSDTDIINSHIAIYLLNLNTLKEAKIYAESSGNK